jgi:ATP-dependent Lon protease
MKKVLIPEENAKDLAEIPASVKNGLEIVPCRAWSRCSSTRSCGAPEAIEWDEKWTPTKPCSPEDDTSGLVAH